MNFIGKTICWVMVLCAAPNALLIFLADDTALRLNAFSVCALAVANIVAQFHIAQLERR